MATARVKEKTEALDNQPTEAAAELTDATTVKGEAEAKIKELEAALKETETKAEEFRKAFESAQEELKSSLEKSILKKVIGDKKINIRKAPVKGDNVLYAVVPGTELEVVGDAVGFEGWTLVKIPTYVVSEFLG